MIDGLLFCEVGWEALKDNETGPADHTLSHGGCRELKRSESHSWSKIIWASQWDRGVPTRKLNKENYQSAPLLLCSSFKRHRCNYRECELTQAAYESAKGVGFQIKLMQTQLLLRAPGRGSDVQTCPHRIVLWLHLNFCSLHSSTLPLGRGLCEVKWGERNGQRAVAEFWGPWAIEKGEVRQLQGRSRAQCVKNFKPRSWVANVIV